MNLFYLPSKNIALTVPLVLSAGFITGLLVNTGPLKTFILPVTILMIYPTMIGFKIGELINLQHKKLIIISAGINFLIIPALAYLLGIVFLLRDPQLFTGLAIASLLPTANMTIAFTMLARGNVPAAVKLTVFSLVLGSLLSPWYLLVMVGRYIPVDVLATLKTITLVVFLPLVMGTLTYSLLLKKYTIEEFNRKIKPKLPAASAWGMVYIIFTSISSNSKNIVSQPQLLLLAFLVLIIFYTVNYSVAVGIGRYLFDKKDSFALVFSTVLRNLSISIGLAATAFGVNAALMVSLAFIIQPQAAAWFIKLVQMYNIFPEKAKH
ncbi:MAG: arsenic resistance protein [Bacillota bacterium]